MPKYTATRIQLTEKGWSVQGQNADHTHNWIDLHIYKNLYPEHDPMTRIIRHMAKTEASALAQSLSKQTTEQVICYDEHDNIVSLFVNGKNIKFFGI